MQAIDHINVLLELQKMPFDFVENYSVVLMGSSHGGYLAHLIAKFAPHKIDYVIDNSCYVKPPMNYFLGKEIDIMQPEFSIHYDNFCINCFVQTLWTTNTHSKNLFTANHYKIRDLNDSVHISAMSNLTSSDTKFVSYHSTSDGIANIDDKITFYKELKSLGYDAELHIINSASMVDGKFIKTLSHGMDMSLKELAKRELPKALSIEKTNKTKEKELVYRCDTTEYRFVYQNNKLNMLVNNL